MECTFCATPIPDDSVFCMNCGSRVSDAEEQAKVSAALDPSATLQMERQLKEIVAPDFKIGRRLGRGGMAMVYLATEVDLDRKVAIKVLPPELTFGHGAERFRREAKTAASLDHPHIIPIYRVSSGDPIFWYVMKYIEGPTLDEILKERGRLPVEETITILRPVADALDYAEVVGDEDVG